MRANQAIRPAPAQAVLGAPARPVFGADPAFISEAVDRLEQRRIIDLALVRLVAAWPRGALHMADHRQVFLQPMEEIAPPGLHMAEIEVDAQVRFADLSDDVGGVLRAVVEIIWPVARIDPLDQQGDIRGGGEINY